MGNVIIEKLKPRIIPLPEGLTQKNLNVAIATWFGSGRFRPGPGTMGTLAAMPPGYLITYLLGPMGLFIAAVLLFFLGMMASDYYGKKSGEKDDQTIVVDEVVGLWLAAIPADTYWPLWFVAFMFFRFFDIYKPWPASYFDNRKRGGVDVMMDDVVAGFFAFLCTATTAYDTYK
jgi:phosphatidylglycerophosphatase A